MKSTKQSGWLLYLDKSLKRVKKETNFETAKKKAAELGLPFIYHPETARIVWVN